MIEPIKKRPKPIIFKKEILQSAHYNFESLKSNTKIYWGLCWLDKDFYPLSELKRFFTSIIQLLYVEKGFSMPDEHEALSDIENFLREMHLLNRNTMSQLSYGAFKRKAIFLKRSDIKYLIKNDKGEQYVNHI